jgi:hypothetical protein
MGQGYVEATEHYGGAPRWVVAGWSPLRGGQSLERRLTLSTLSPTFSCAVCVTEERVNTSPFGGGEFAFNSSKNGSHCHVTKIIRSDLLVAEPISRFPCRRLPFLRTSVPGKWEILVDWPLDALIPAFAHVGVYKISRPAVMWSPSETRFPSHHFRTDDSGIGICSSSH